MTGKDIIISARQVTDDPYQQILDCLIDIKGMESINRAGLIVLKPNFVSDNIDYIKRGANTSREVIESVLRIIRERNKRAKIIIGEGDTGIPEVKGRRIQRTYRLMELQKLGDKYNAELVNYTHSEQVEVQIPDGLHLKKIMLPKYVMDCDLLINLPKIKTHKYAKLTCSMKNIFGIIPDPKRVHYHSHLHDVIVDLNRLVIHKTLNVVDGLISMEGNGPLFGNPMDTNYILVSSDSLALDVHICRMIGLNPYKIPYLKKAIAMDMGNHKNYIAEGTDGWNFTFKPAKNNLYVRFELWVARTPLIKLFMNKFFLKHVSKRIHPITSRLRGGSFTWYEGEDY